MKPILLLFGNFTFNHFTESELSLFKENTERKALLHSVDAVFKCKNEAELNRFIDDLENDYEAWITPSTFNGEIVLEFAPDKTVEQLYN